MKLVWCYTKQNTVLSLIVLVLCHILLQILNPLLIKSYDLFIFKTITKLTWINIFIIFWELVICIKIAQTIIFLKFINHVIHIVLLSIFLNQYFLLAFLHRPSQFVKYAFLKSVNILLVLLFNVNISVVASKEYILTFMDDLSAMVNSGLNLAHFSLDLNLITNIFLFGRAILDEHPITAMRLLWFAWIWVLHYLNVMILVFNCHIFVLPLVIIWNDLVWIFYHIDCV